MLEWEVDVAISAAEYTHSKKLRALDEKELYENRIRAEDHKRAWKHSNTWISLMYSNIYFEIISCHHFKIKKNLKY